MKKVIITLGLLFCVCSGLFSLGCPEREMSRSDEEPTVSHTESLSY